MNLESPIVRLPELMKIVCLCKGSIYRGIKTGQFPAPVKLTQRAVGWRRTDIERWIADPAAYRAQKQQLPHRLPADQNEVFA
jgi:prophage regulatory protein